MQCNTINIENISKSFGKFTALEDINFTLNLGITGLLGPNGAGKTTLMRILSGLTLQSDGFIDADTFDFGNKALLRKHIGYMPQTFDMYPNFSLYQNLDYLAILSDIEDRHLRHQRIMTLLSDLGLTEHKNKKYKMLSGGMKRRFGLAQALLHNPPILVLDEPTVGVDPHERQNLRQYISEISEDKIVLYSTHIIEDIQYTCENIAILNHGKQVYFGDVSVLSERIQGKVYQGMVEKLDYHNVINTLKMANAYIVSDIKTQNGIRLRVICDKACHPKFFEVEPTLEDAYFYIMSERAND